MKARMNLRPGRARYRATMPKPEYALANGWHSTEQQFEFQFGAYGWTRVRVYEADFESAFEIAVEWLDDHAPGHLCDVTEADLKESAEELGLDYEQAARDARDGVSDSDYDRIVEHAETDLTLIGHTTLKHGQYLRSWEWTGGEVS